MEMVVTLNMKFLIIDLINVLYQEKVIVSSNAIIF